MMKTGLNNKTMFFIYLAFFLIILIPLYVIVFLFYVYYLNINMPLFLFLLPLVAFGLYTIYVLIFITEAVIVLGFVNHRVKEGKYKTTQVNLSTASFLINDVFNRMIEALLDKVLLPKSSIADLLFHLFGAKLGKNVHLGSPVFDPYLVEIGDNSVIGKNSLILGHFIEGDNLILKKTRIGKNVTIGAYSIISPGAVIEDDVIVAANSFVRKDAVLKKGCMYAGNPAVLKKKLTRKR